MVKNIQSLERAFLILEKFKDYPNGISLTELSKEVGLHKSTVHRFLSTLISLNYVEQNPDDTYQLTFKLLDIMSKKLDSIDYRSTSHNLMVKLCEDVNEVIHLVVQDGIHVVYIDKIEADNTITMASRVGIRSPMIYTSVGKAILSYKSDEEIKKIWDETPKEVKAKNTITDFNVFMEEIENVRKSKIAVDNEENEEDIYCIGTAIVNNLGKVEGALSITGPVFRMKKKMKENIQDKLLETASEISKNIGYRNY